MVQEQQTGPGPAPEHDEDSITMGLQEVIANEVKSQIANVLAKVHDMMGEAIY